MEHNYIAAHFCKQCRETWSHDGCFAHLFPLSFNEVDICPNCSAQVYFPWYYIDVTESTTFEQFVELERAKAGV